MGPSNGCSCFESLITLISTPYPKISSVFKGRFHAILKQISSFSILSRQSSKSESGTQIASEGFGETPIRGRCIGVPLSLGTVIGGHYNRMMITHHSSSLESSSSSSSSAAAAAFFAGFFFFFLFLFFAPVDFEIGCSRIFKISSSSIFLSDLTASKSNGGGAANRVMPFFVTALHRSAKFTER